MNFYHLRDFLAMVLMSFGVLIPPSIYLSGLFLSFAGAYLTMIWVPEEKKVELRSVLALAFFVSTLVAVAHDHFLSHWPVQLKMAFAGAFARWIVLIFANYFKKRAKNGDVV